VDTGQPFVNENDVIVIPKKSDRADARDGKKLRVAAYCRVSTKTDEQALSYEAQKEYYRDYIERNPDWEVAGIYADKMSGTDTQKRDGFMRLIEDCKQGKIDRVITKSLERFSRNAKQFLNTIDELRMLNPPVTVWFETDGIDSIKDRYEPDLHLGIFVAQHESVKKSRNIKWRWKLNFAKGKALMPTHCILGYDKDVNGNIVIVPKEAKVVRFIYDSYLDGKCAA
jgi:DNA invertase Pin-like site-specific DNA recombinase